MTDIIDRVCEALDRLSVDGHTPTCILIGNREADELEAALYRPARPARSEWVAGRLIVWDEGEEEYAPKLPLDMGLAEIFGVRVKRVDQETLLGVIAAQEEAR